MDGALHETAARVTAAKTPEDLFGASADGLGVAYRRLAARLHPDRYTGADADIAARAFIRLTALRDEAEGRLAPSVVTTKTRTYTIGRRIAKGDLADLRACTWDGGEGVVKIAHLAGESDLLDNEARLLRRVAGSGRFPSLVDRATLDHGRRANVLSSFVGRRSLGEVIAAGGLDLRAATTILASILRALAVAHRKGVIVGAVLPPSVFVEPRTSHAMLVDLCFASTGAPIVAFSIAHRAFYPPEVFAKKPPTPATDLFMWAGCAKALVGSEMPRPLERFLASCLAPSPRRRPDDAFALHDEFDALMKHHTKK